MFSHLLNTFFFTATINSWQNLLQKNEHKQIVMNSLEYCVNAKRIHLHAFVLMPNHVHLLLTLRDNETTLDFQRDFLKFTAQQIIKTIIKIGNEEELENYKSTQKDRIYHIWERRPIPMNIGRIAIKNEAILSQKVDYIHNNPLQPKWNLVLCAEDYPWSSASYYLNNSNTFPFLTSYFD